MPGEWKNSLVVIVFIASNIADGRWRRKANPGVRRKPAGGPTDARCPADGRATRWFTRRAGRLAPLRPGVQMCTFFHMIATSYRYLVQAPGVRSGHSIVEGTRIGVHDVVAMVKTGASVDEVVASFPRLTRAQVYECLAYYEDHKAEIGRLVAPQIAHLDE